MQFSRRWLITGLSAAGLAGCASSNSAISASRSGLPPEFLPQRNPAYDRWVQAFQTRARSRGISDATLRTAFQGAGYLPGVVERDRNQTETKRSLEDYLAIVANDTKVAEGRRKRAAFSGILGEIERRYGVPANVVAAVWGMESNYGARRGDIPVISAVSTLAYDGRRGAFFEKQLMAALRILARRDVSAANLTGSWAGAMGHTQFIPTTFEAYAVDFRGDGRRDIWSDDPTDALASAAAYLAKSGWRSGQPWGLEISLPAGFSSGLAGRGNKRSIASWRDLGVRTASGGTLPDHGSAALLLPQGPNAPAFLVFSNFNAILRYNNSENYGIGIGYLSDRINGAGPLRKAFPPDRNGLTINDRKELQRLLTARGFDAGVADGVLGAKSQAAISAYQRSIGVAVTGEPSLTLLASLR
jgi:lytic murein transglycosylase